MNDTYAGDIAPRAAWDILERDPRAVLIDVRTVPEWLYVGLPDLSSLGKRTYRICWQDYPAMNLNPHFVREVEESGISADQPVLLLCRSGVRSRHAAVALTAHGFAHCYNVAGGFEGNHDDQRHRGSHDGWKVADLPWRQD